MHNLQVNLQSWIRIISKIPNYVPYLWTKDFSRIRHVNCDETKPNCRRCLSTGWTCDGYAPPKQRAKRKSNSSPNASSLILTAPNQDVQGVDSRYFDFFRSYALQDLSAAFDSTYWSRYVLQGCHHEAAIKQLR